MLDQENLKKKKEEEKYNYLSLARGGRMQAPSRGEAKRSSGAAGLYNFFFENRILMTILFFFIGTVLYAKLNICGIPESSIEEILITGATRATSPTASPTAKITTMAQRRAQWAFKRQLMHARNGSGIIFTFHIAHHGGTYPRNFRDVRCFLVEL